MGLCKCPKKKVTNQFCFEHRVNVCEHCMVTSHPKCIVQSYLQWLQDSDYEPVCQLCRKSLATEDCIRLICYHVFHWRCLNSYAEQLPANTAPAGYVCPTCKSGIFPAENVVSPVTDVLRSILSKVNWAHAGLGLPLIDEQEQSLPITDSGAHPTGISFTGPRLNPVNETTLAAVPAKHTSASSSTSLRSHSVVPVDNYFVGSSSNSAGARMTSFPTGTLPRKVFNTTVKDGDHKPLIDHDEDKYKRRPAFQWFDRWFRSRASLQGRPHSHLGHFYKRWVILALIGFIGLCTLVMVFIQLGRNSANTDPLLDPLMNPQIHVKDSASADPLLDPLMNPQIHMKDSASADPLLDPLMNSKIHVKVSASKDPLLDPLMNPQIHMKDTASTDLVHPKIPVDGEGS